MIRAKIIGGTRDGEDISLPDSVVPHEFVQLPDKLDYAVDFNMDAKAVQEIKVSRYRLMYDQSFAGYILRIQ